jgi:hypothetical protein
MNIVSDGALRLLFGRQAATMESLEKKYATQLAQASPDEKSKIRERMADEHRRLSKNADHEPSPGTLW